MLIPLGILASAGAGDSVPAYEQIATTLVSSASSTITFSSIPQTYKHLQIRLTAQNDSAAFSALVGFYLNGSQASSTYTCHRMVGQGGSITPVSNEPTNNVLMGAIYAGNFGGPWFSSVVIDILDYASTSKNTTTRFLMNGISGTNPHITYGSGLWLNTAAVTSISLASLSGGAYASGSRFSLYGIKG